MALLAARTRDVAGAEDALADALVAGAGYRVVFTPHAALVHNKSSSTSSEADADEAARLRMRWSDRLAQDPYYNRNFSRDTPDYEPDLTAGVTLEP